MIDQGIFKSYDIRGVYPREINKEVAFKVGVSLVKFLKRKLKKKNLRIVVGRDCRLSSPSLFQFLCQGIFREKAIVVDIGLVSTDTLYFALSHFRYDGGVMITASHNPKDSNGFKMLARNQKFIYQGWGMKEIKKLVNGTDFNSTGIKGKIVKKEVIPSYVKHILRAVNHINLRRLKAVVDAGNGMGGRNIREISRKVPVVLYPLYFSLNGRFPFRPPDPTVGENIRDCRRAVVREKADFGLAFDADADRTVFIDEKGKVVKGDILLALFSRYFLKKYPGKSVVYNLICSRIVREAIKGEGGRPIRARTGRSFIREIAIKNNAVLAGEKSGHLLFPEVFYSESGGLAFLAMLMILSENEKSLSELIEPFRKYYQEESNFKVKGKDKDKIMKKMVREYRAEKHDFLDGLTVETDDWWFNLRPSNTEPYLRLTIEAKNKKIVREIYGRLKRTITA